MSDTQQTLTPPDDVSRVNKERLIYLGLLVAAVVVAGYFFLKTQTASSDIRAENAELRRENANIQTRLDEIDAHDLLLKQEKSVKQSKLSVIKAKAHDAATAIDALEKETGQWRSTNDQLRTTDKGRALSANRELLTQYHALIKQPRPSPALPATLHSRLEPLQTLIEQASTAKNPLFSLSEQLESQVAAIETEANESLTLYHDHNQQLQVILARVPAGRPAGTLTLDEALKEIEGQYADQRTKQLAKALDEARRLNDDKDAQALANSETKKRETDRVNKQKLEQAEREHAKAEADRKAAEIDRDTQRNKDDTSELALKKKQDEEEASLDREFQKDLPDIQAHLRPMFAASNYQPAPGAMRRLTNTKGPMSLNAIRTSGALAEGKAGLFSLFATVNVDPERKKIGWPEFTTDSTEFFLKAQQYLTKYGDLMVKKGHLAK